MVYLKSIDKDYLSHHGVKGQKWGVRRYQNPDGSRTAAGKRHEQNVQSRRGLSDNAKQNLKTAALMVGTAALTAGAIYGGAKLSDLVKDRAFEMTMNEGLDALNKIKSNTSAWKRAASSVDSEYGKSYAEHILSIEKNEAANSRKTAEYNSSSFKNAVKTLRGEGARTQISKKVGQYTDDVDSASRKAVEDKGYSYYDVSGSRGRDIALFKKGSDPSKVMEKAMRAEELLKKKSR